MKDWKKVMVAGSGTLGSQIAFQVAYKGYEVRIYDINDEAIAKAKERVQELYGIYKDEIQESEKQIEKIRIVKTSFFPPFKKFGNMKKRTCCKFWKIR